MGQMYRLLDAGTAKPPTDSGVVHHLIDVLDPEEPADAARYAALAREAIAGIRARGRPVVLAGGTGFYIKALLEGLDDLPPRDPELRARLAALAAEKGRPWLHARLAEKDPAAARRIPLGNLQRVVRALEVIEKSGRPVSELLGRPRARVPAAYYGVHRSKEELSRRIRQRAEAMFPRIVEEVRRLVPSRYTGEEPGFRCLGYPQALACARGEATPEEGLAAMIKETEAYAKRQLTWFRNQAQVAWLAPGELPPL